MSILSPLLQRNKESTVEEMHRLATKDAYNTAVKMFISMLWEEEEARRIEFMYAVDPIDWLKNSLVIGRANIITGLPDTGKTNLFFLLAELALADDWAVGINVPCNDSRVAFYRTKEELENFLAIPKFKLIGFDDAGIYVSSRRSGSKVSEFFRSLHIKARKPVPEDESIPGGAIIWLSQDPEIINIDFRKRFTAWQLHKPSVELRDAARIAYEKGKIPIELKKVVWAYFLVRDKDGKTKKRLIWWTDAVPKSKIDYHHKALGEFYLDTAEKTLRIEVKPVYGDLKVVKESEELRQDLNERLFAHLTKYGKPEAVNMLAEWLSGEPQRAIARRHKLSQDTVRQWIQPLRENGLGYAFEDAWAETYPSHKMGGKNSPQPDAIEESSQTVYSLKCYADPKLNLASAVKGIAKSELDLLATGWNLKLVIFEVFSKTLHVYKVVKASE